jgi:succinate dehydrogenase / fumarate reductase cytochrome b subunit
MQRPLSPFFSVYRMSRYTLATSIFNRFTGLALSVGLILLVSWLMAAAGGRDTYEHARAFLGQPAFKLVYGGLIVAFSYHLIAGIRHLIWDTGHGLERAQAMRSSAVVVIATLLLVALLVWGLLVRSPAP